MRHTVGRTDRLNINDNLTTLYFRQQHFFRGTNLDIVVEKTVKIKKTKVGVLKLFISTVFILTQVSLEGGVLCRSRFTIRTNTNVSMLNTVLLLSVLTIYLKISIGQCKII